MNITITYKCEMCNKRVSYQIGEAELDSIQMTTVLCDILERPYCGVCDWHEVLGHSDTVDPDELLSTHCGHEEWMWEEGDKICLICGFNMTCGVDYAEQCRIEDEYEARMEDEADLYEESYDERCACGCDNCDGTCERGIARDRAHREEQAYYAMCERLGLDPNNSEDMTGQYVEREIVEGELVATVPDPLDDDIPF